MDAYDRLAIDDWFDRMGGREEMIERFDWQPPPPKERRNNARKDQASRREEAEVA
jgi:hypothetical protein